MPAGPKGRFAPFLPYFWGVWSFGKNKEAAKSLLTHLSQPSSIEKFVAVSGGYDLPAYANLTFLKTWAEEGPPKGPLSFGYSVVDSHSSCRPVKAKTRRSGFYEEVKLTDKPLSFGYSVVDSHSSCRPVKA
ncbi:hypothetical protein [Salmonella enterica]|uniref:hypothetical protein n=1 Tax=Salmonella enterica TaxID=28901 RepID=UPI001CA5C164|nr:hypothetical protein [Salmonella enterica]